MSPPDVERSYVAKARRALAGVVLLVVGFGMGVWVSGEPRYAEADSSPNPYIRLNTFAKVMSYIERSYVTPIDQEGLIDSAIKGMVASLDPHSMYLAPKEYKALREETDGEFIGIGLEIGMRDEHIQIIAPIEGAPAERAGVQAGDLLMRIDGQLTRGWTLRKAVQKLKGLKGTGVSVEVLRLPPHMPKQKLKLDGGVSHKFNLTREVISVVSVSARLMENGFGYIRLRSFQEDVTEDISDAYEDLRAEAGNDLAGLVLDLRNNPGGLLVEAVQTVDLFIDDGVIVSTEGRTRKGNEVYRATSTATRIEVPLVVLINGGSASASEIVAGAVKEHARGVVLGSRSFGKGSVQSIIDMKDGSGLKLTTALYYTPNHASIHGKGIAPDIEIMQIPEAALKGDKAASGDKKRWFDSDYQLRMALQHLKAFVSLNTQDEQDK